MAGLRWKKRGKPTYRTSPVWSWGPSLPCSFSLDFSPTLHLTFLYKYPPHLITHPLYKTCASENSIFKTTQRQDERRNLKKHLPSFFQKFRGHLIKGKHVFFVFFLNPLYIQMDSPSFDKRYDSAKAQNDRGWKDCWRISWIPFYVHQQKSVKVQLNSFERKKAAACLWFFFFFFFQLMF